MGERDDRDRLQGEIEELFADLWQVPRFAGLRQGFRPPADCYRTEDPPELRVVVELAGVDPGTVEITCAARSLVISGERARPELPGRVYHRMEIEYGSFQRHITLAENVDPERAQATYERGLLTIVLPVIARRLEPHRVPVEVKARP